MRKNVIKVWIEDDKVYISCNHGQVEVNDKTDSWLHILNAIAFPEENMIEIIDKRNHRQEHQKDISCVVNEI